MNRWVVIIIMLLMGGISSSQNLNSMCYIQVMNIEDSTLLDIVDTLLLIEQESGNSLPEIDNVSIAFIDTNGLLCIIKVVKNSLYKAVFLSSMIEHIRISYYRNINIVISGAIPNKRIMTSSGEYKQVSCISDSDENTLYEDYIDNTCIPNFSILARWQNDHMQIYMVVNKKGEIIYDSSNDESHGFIYQSE